jgi:hypothetical protein
MGARRIRFADVAAGLALVIAVATGGAYAASTLGKNTVSSKQVKNQSLKGKDVKNDSLAGADINESSLTLPSGPEGPTGPQGQTGSTGPAGPLLETLPSGKTLRGDWMVGDRAAAVGAASENAVTFQIPLAADPQGRVRDVGDPSIDICPGSVSQPAAAPGWACVYVGAKNNVSFISLCDSINGGCGPLSANRFGFGIQVQAAAIGSFVASGTWAVTAP